MLDPDGKPVSGADVAVLARKQLRFSIWEKPLFTRQEVVGRTKTDAEGKFNLTVARGTGVSSWQARVLATDGKHGLGWQPVSPADGSAAVEIRLPAEQLIRGRLFDLQGQPAAGVKVRIGSLARKAQGNAAADTFWPPEEGLPLGPKIAASDDKGRFTIRGLGSDLTVGLQVHGDRFYLDNLSVATADKAKAENIKAVLTPSHTVEGRVVYEDTGKPVTGADLDVSFYQRNEQGRLVGGGMVDGRTDERGRYRVRFPSATTLGVNVRAPGGAPYLGIWKSVEWPKGAVRQEIDIRLPRGQLVRGKITEASGGKPVAGAYVGFIGTDREALRKRNISATWDKRVVSGADGTFQIGVPAGPGYLFVNGPTPHYIPRIIGSASIQLGKPGGDPMYYHEVVALNLKPEEKTKEVSVTLRRGVTLKGRLVGPDGKPVKQAIMFCGSHPIPYEKNITPLTITDGRFELPGCDPERTYRLVFLATAKKPQLTMLGEAPGSNGRLWLRELLDPDAKLGAAVELPAKEAAARPAVVRLAPCGTAKLTFERANSKPAANHNPWLQLVVSPGPSFTKALEQGTLAAETVTLAAPFGRPNSMPPQADAAGRITIAGLIPGATYRILANDREPLQDFQVEAGKTLELKIVVK